MSNGWVAQRYLLIVYLRLPVRSVAELKLTLQAVPNNLARLNK